MMILSEGVRRPVPFSVWRRSSLPTLARASTGDSAQRPGSSLSAIINNTAAVAALLPVVSHLAHEHGTSPSKLLIPPSDASMAGGILTHIGTPTNLLASGVASRLATDYPSVHAFPMFEFTQFGLVVFLVTAAYLSTVGYWLAPSHVTPRSKLATTQTEGVLTRVIVGDESPFVGSTVREALEAAAYRGARDGLWLPSSYVRIPSRAVARKTYSANRASRYHMTRHDADLDFPNCCACCPHLRDVKASCTHELRQSLLRELATDHSCPVYSREKTDAMQQLVDGY